MINNFAARLTLSVGSTQTGRAFICTEEPVNVFMGWGPCNECVRGGWNNPCQGYQGSGDTQTSSCTRCGHAFGYHG